jgi:hypothetical protein
MIIDNAPQLISRKEEDVKAKFFDGRILSNTQRVVAFIDNIP